MVLLFRSLDSAFGLARDDRAKVFFAGMLGRKDKG